MEVTGVEGGPTVHSQASSIFISGHFQILLVRKRYQRLISSHTPVGQSEKKRTNSSDIWFK